MLEFASSVFYYLTYDFGVYAPIIAVALFISNAVVFGVQTALLFFRKVKRDSAYFLCFSLVCLALSAYFSIQDYFGKGLLFNGFWRIYSFLTCYSVLVIIFFAVLKKLASKSEKQSDKAVNCYIEEVPLQTGKVYNYFKKDEIFSGYLDVSYVRQLINELKTKPLSESDYQNIEEFEVYLLRFITRQPNEDERVVLSEYLSMLVNKLATYSCAC